MLSSNSANTNNSNVNQGIVNQGNVNQGSDIDFSFILASSVHDMKNSLGMLLNSLEETITESSDVDKQQSDRFSTLQYEASRINTELVQLLSLYRFQHQALMINVDEHFVIDTIEDQIARNDMLFKTQGVELIIDCDDDLSWYYDNDLLGSVIHNVMVNGARYADKKMCLRASIENDSLVVEILDDGKGFPEKMINAAALTSEAHSDGNSTQLGLYFAAKIAEMHKQDDRCGSISLSNGSDFGGGVFKIYIP